MYQLALSLILTLLLASTSYASLNHTQQQYIQAEKALNNGNISQYKKLKSTLKDYPLYGYLVYQEHLKNLNTLTATDLLGFQKQYSDSPISSRLTLKWLKQRGQSKQWKDFLSVYDNQRNTQVRCYYLQALINTGKKNAAFDKVPPIWISGKSQPKSCDPVFAKWQKSQHLTKERVLQRATLALEKNNTRLATYLSRFLKNNDDKLFLNRWVHLHRSPLIFSNDIKQLPAHSNYKVAVIDILSRLIKRQPEVALHQLNDLMIATHLGTTERERLNQKLAYRLLLSHDDINTALDFSTSISSPNEKLAEFRLRKAITNNRWELANKWLKQLPKDKQSTSRWLYWSGRLASFNGDTKQAQQYYEEAANDRGYYGFLAADKIGKSYNLSHEDLTVPADNKRLFQDKAAIKRIAELYDLDKNIAARREWHYLTRHLDNETLKVAAKIAHEQGWRDRAIFTLAKTQYWEDLNLRFPILHLADVNQQAKTNTLDPSWILAVIRQESVFMHDARSHAGATGLMQLMPATAKRVARKLGQQSPRLSDLQNPTTNIRLGSYYLKTVWKQLNNNKVLATAAYNAGPHRVKKWLPEKTVDTDIWVESIPFKETRGYVKRVLSYTVLYQHLQGKTPQRISDLMGEIYSPRLAEHNQGKNKKS